MSDESTSVETSTVETTNQDNSLNNETVNTDNNVSSKETQLKEVIKEAKSPEQKKEAVKQLKKFKLKLEGKEEEFEVDLNNEEELKKHFQLSKMSNKRMQEKAELEKNIEQFVEMLRKDPFKVLSHPDIGHDAKKLAQDFINKQLEEEAKSPEQKRIEELERKIKEKEDNEKIEKEKRETDENQRLQTHLEETITNDIISALEEVKLPKSPRAVKYMAEYMELALKNNMEVSAKDVAPLVKQKMVDDYKELLRNSPDEILEQFIDKDIETRLQKKRIASLKKPTEPIAQIKETGSTTQSTKKEKTKKRIDDWLNEE